MSKLSFVCHTNPTSERKCKENYEVTSGGMEVAGVLNIFNFSICAQGICYTKYLGDGDSKAYQKVFADKHCGPNISVTKLECIVHVQKRMGARLRRLVKEKTGTNFMTANLLEAKVATLTLK